MEIDTQIKSLPILKSLASESRLKIINLLGNDEYNIKQIANKLYLSNGIVTRHIKQLEEADIVRTKVIPTNSGTQKVCKLAIEELFIRFPRKIFPQYEFYQTTIRVGHFTDYYATPTCGLATKDDYIGELDDPKYFMDSKRMDAEIIWLTEGFLEYKIPNLLNIRLQTPELLEINLELGSEFPVSNNNWPSDIGFYINDTFVGKWTVPGNFSDVRGKLTPQWWPDNNSQYGLLKTLRITSNETLIDGESISDINLNDIEFDRSLITIKLVVEEENNYSGGLTIFGKHFGNYPQHIIYKMYYSEI